MLADLQKETRVYFEEYGVWPTNLTLLLTNKMSGSAGKGFDGWNKPFQFSPYTTNAPGSIISLGADGKQGGRSDKADLVVYFGPGTNQSGMVITLPDSR